MPGPGVGVGGCLRVVARGMAVGGKFRGVSGTPPPTVCPGMGDSGRPRRGGAPRPTDGDMETPAGFTRTPVPGPPRGRGRACPARRFAWADVCGWLPGGWPLAEGFAGRRGRRPLRVARERAVTEGRGGVGAPRPTDGDMETLWGLRGHTFPGRRTVGAGHARSGGWREHPSMVRSVGRGLDPSAGGCPGDGRWRKVSRGVGDAAPYGLPGNGR